MAPTPKNQRTPTPFSKLNLTQIPNSRTPQAKHRLNFTTAKPNSVAPVAAAAEHPIEVIGRIRDYPDRKEKPLSSLQVNPDRETLRVKTDGGYRDFSFDGVSLSEEEDIDEFYKKFVQSRINGVKLGDKCTVMMYGPTGAGKSYNMFGSSKQPGIVYRSLRDILGDGIEENDENNEKISVGTFVQVTVLEIYNEELYDLLSTNNGGGFGFGWSKGSSSKVRLEVIGKKAKNATFISGTEATKISKEIQKVEKRRTVKSTLCNERSSRSHCMMIIDVPTVGGRLMLVDMAGSENIEQAGQTGMEAKMQTAKINQGNSALKRVVESIANGDSHVPFRDSKLTMLLQDSFEDDKSKILMILCASPDPKDLHKTISTLEYGAKAKCIVRGPHTPLKENGAEDSSSAVILRSRIAAMDQFIYMLQMENKLKEKECNEAKRKLMKKEEEIATLRSKLELVLQGGVETTEEDIIVKVNERTQMLKREFEYKIQQCQKMANEFVETERRKMEERMFQQQQEFEMLRRRLEEIESELWHSRVGSRSTEVEENSFGKRLLEMYSEDAGMVKSMDLDRSIDMDCGKKAESNTIQAILGYPSITNPREIEDPSILLQHFTNKSFLSTVFEEEEEGNDSEGDKENPYVEEVQKEVIEEKTICSGNVSTVEDRSDDLSSDNTAPSRKELIQNIFKLCGNSRELSQQCTTPSVPAEKRVNDTESKSPPVKEIVEVSPITKNHNFSTEKTCSTPKSWSTLYKNTKNSREYSRPWKGSMEQSMKNMRINEEEKEMTIYLKINKTVALRVKESDSIGNIKSLLHDKEGIPECLQHLVSKGVELADELKLVDYGITKNSLLHASIDNSVSRIFFVKRPYAIDAITVSSRISDTIQDVKYRIGASEGVESTEFSLIHDGRFLDDDRTLVFYKIDGGSTLHMVLYPRDKFLISMVMPWEKIVKIEVKAALTVRDMKRSLESRVGYPKNSMDLFLGKQKLEDSKTLYQCDINEESVILVKCRTMQIFINTGDGSTTLDVHRHELIRNMKLMILKKLKIPVHLQKLIYAGKCLLDHRDLASYNVTRESNIIFDIRLPPPANIYEGSLPYFMSYQPESNMRCYHQTSLRKIKGVVSRFTSIAHLKTLIKYDLKLNVKELYLRGKLLNDLCCLGKYGITKKTELGILC
ncbi:hypothetical protein KY284_015723 [Solanum tuberosum]|nr:hypothetical protein KY284_015723 [Solanum tuberosum]